MTAEEIAEVNKTKPTRLPPLLFESPHEAAPSFHEDWTIVPGSRYDPEAWEMELRLRDVRNKMIREQLAEGRAVFYKSSGNSMWPLVQSEDACTFHPIQAVTARDGMHGFRKEASELSVGDIVFCQVQESQQYYAHIILVKDEWGPRGGYRNEPKYWIGNIQNSCNGWCYREHIFGILVHVEVWTDGQYYARPHPKSIFEEVFALVRDERWDTRAEELAKPLWQGGA